MLEKKGLSSYLRRFGLATVLATGGVFGVAPAAAEQIEQVAQRTYLPSGHFEGSYEIVLDKTTSFLLEPTLASERIELSQIESFEEFGNLAGRKIIRYTDGSTVASLPDSKGETWDTYLMFEVQALGRTMSVFFPTDLDSHISHSPGLLKMAYKGHPPGEISVE